MTASAAYPAIVERGPEGFGVFFPDLPGCTSFGASRVEAAWNARQVLSMHLEGLRDDGDPVPPPSALHAIVAGPGVAEVARIMVPDAEPTAHQAGIAAAAGFGNDGTPRP